MGKLIKYELRKSRNALGVLLMAIAALELYFLIALRAEAEGHIATSAILLAVSGFATGITVFALGISAYSSELKQKTSYLIFMTPNSALSIMSAKMLYTMITTLVFTALLGGLCALDVKLLLDYLDEWSDFYQTINEILIQYGVRLNEFYLLIAFNAASVFLLVLSALVTAYLAITFSATVMQERRGRGLISVLIYCAIIFGLSQLNRLYTDEHAVYDSVQAILRALAPSVIQNIAVIVLCLIGCSWMLERKVSL